MISQHDPNQSASAQLLNETQGNAVVANKVQFATSFLERAVGLMGKRDLPNGQTLLIKGTKYAACNSVHTCFMRFPIDVVFVDDEMKVRSIVRNLKPWRITWPAFGATCAFEFSAGQAPAELKLGDALKIRASDGVDHVGN
ncbi:MAG: DUF192 domain-containing protein [Proteobacteria bacterium]|nr:MAG: DUF192 domain-containing protein [Pseudomonadota bacterium]